MDLEFINNGIPKLIHQIWIGPKKIPNYWTNTFSELYIENNKDYEYKLWNNDNYSDELNKYPVLKIIFDNFEHHCYKVDILRLIILYEYGGIYIDADSVWLNNKSFNELLEKSKNTYFFVGTSPNENENSKFFLTNGVFGCKKSHPYLKNMINYLENLIYNYHSHKYDKRLVIKKFIERSLVCGPGLFTRELKNKNVTIFPSHYFYPIWWHNLNINNIDYDKYKESHMFQYGETTNNLEPLTDINIYWINMDRNLERRKHMYYLFSKHLIYNYRINAYDGNKIQEYDDIDYSSFNSVHKYECFRSFSHLKAIKTSYDNNDNISIICEDDLCIDYKQKWKHNLENIILIGAAFKEDTDDLRNSPTIDLYNSLKSQNCNVQILDTSLSLKDMQQLTNVHDINENSLIVYMYPPKEDLEEQINSYIENKNCYIYYPWK